MNNNHILEHNLHQRNNVLKCFSNAEDVLNKGGEGSKGGKIIGHTKSGKPIYRSSFKKNEYGRHESGSSISDLYKEKTKDYDSKDHEEAYKLHDKLSDKKLNSNSFDISSQVQNHFHHHSELAEYHRQISEKKS